MANQPLPDVETEFDLEATMRDGAVLRADAYRPAGDGPWPVLLARTPYGKQDPGVLERLDPHAAAGRGYLVIIQDCRGRFGSDGDWAPLVHERDDGYDSVRWAASLPGANGRVGMYGPSYLGYAQWAAISTQPPELRAAAPEFAWSQPHDGLISRGGVYELGLMTQWTLSLGVNVLERRYADRPAERRRRLVELDSAIDELAERTYWERPIDAPLRRFDLPAPKSDPVGSHSVGSDSMGDVVAATVPTLVVAGWSDSFLQGCLDNYANARDAGTPTALIVGPWSHGDQTEGIDEDGWLLKRELDWLDRYLKPEEEPGPSSPEAPVLLFVTGTDRWRRLPNWPPESINVPWYLHAGGRLSPDVPEPDSAPDVFEHDPSDPVPTCGGALLLTARFPAGPRDQEQIEKRDDVLVYTSEPLTEPLEVIGRIRVHLAADSTAPSADWVARLCDVDVEGVSRNITDGILRTHDPMSEHIPVSEHVIDLWSAAHVFLPGHRIRVQLASSCFPRWDRNFSAPVARQSVYHDAARPSRIILPVPSVGHAPADTGRSGTG